MILVDNESTKSTEQTSSDEATLQRKAPQICEVAPLEDSSAGNGNEDPEFARCDQGPRAGQLQGDAAERPEELQRNTTEPTERTLSGDVDTVADECVLQALPRNHLLRKL